MDTAATEGAFHINPPVSGNFIWINGSKSFTFFPSLLLSTDTKYTVSLDSSAASILNVSTDSILSFSFYTKPAIPLSVINTYPANNQDNISTTVKVIIEFNTPLVNSGLNGYVQIQDSAENSIRLNNPLYYTSNNKGYLSFSTYDPLNYNSTYKVTIKNAVQNVYTSTLGNDYIFSFRTGSNNYVKGTIIESFVSEENWLQPSLSKGSVDIDTNKTKFIAFYGTSPEGSHLGKLTYKFSQDSGGICNLLNTDNPSMNSAKKDYFGFWVYGDLSENYIGCIFTINKTQKESITLDSLNWTGWKFIKIPFNNITRQQPEGEVLFDGIYIKQNNLGADSNQVSFAGVQYNDSISTAIKNENNNSVPDKFELAQNYPNPFNPTTQIKFGIPQAGFVKLEIFNLLGQKISTLINEEMNAGYHFINFDGKNLPSGIYFYTLSFNNFKTSRKMLLLK